MRSGLKNFLNPMDRFLNTCSICAELQGNSESFGWKAYASLVSSGKNRLATSGMFDLIPSIGALNASHVLLVPRFHVGSIACLSDPRFEELTDFAVQLENFSNQVHGKQLLFFEHGAGTDIDNSGGCVDHAHLHAVSKVPNFLTKLRKHCHLTPLPDFHAARQVADTARGYILVRDEAGVVWLSNNPGVPSQLLRKLYAQCQQWPDVWNWRIDPRMDEIRNVAKTYHSFMSARAGDAELRR